MFEEIAPRGAKPPPTVQALRAMGAIGMAIVVYSIATTEPQPALHGTGLGVLLALITMVAGVLASFPRRLLKPGRRIGGLLAVVAGAIAITGLQPFGAVIGVTFYVVSIASIRMPRRPALVISVLMLAGQSVALAFTASDPGGTIVDLVFSVVPWILVIRLMSELREGRARAEALVEELRESREAHAQAAALAERTRLARDMHDVLAHSLSALALQLEGTRLLARDRDSDPEVVSGVERAHHLAAGGLQEARRAIAALRGDRLPGPEGLQELADAFAEHSRASCALTVTGEPRPLSSEARLALYRTAQEALTNVRKHAAADRVELRLDYAPDGVTLAVRDHGPGAPVAVGGEGGGYGLTGMRERAELLGGRLSAGPVDDGFCVDLWLPA